MKGEECNQASQAGQGTMYPLSFSSQALFEHACKRKYELYKLLNYAPLRVRNHTVHTAFGTAVGAGVVVLLEDPEALDWALHETFKSWNYTPLFEHINSKSIVTALNAVKEFQYEARKMHEECWEIATIEGDNPAVEVSFKLTIEGYGYYIGYIDAIMHNKKTNQFKVVEVKTMQEDYNSTKWQNRTQDVGYLFIGALTGEYSNSTVYPTYVCSASRGKYWNMPTYERKDIDYEQFLKGLALSFIDIKKCEDVGYFPRSGNCHTFGQECPAFSACREKINKTPMLFDSNESWDIEATINIDKELEEWQS